MSNSRQIGVGFEREIARRFRRWFPDARRGLQYQAGENCRDIVKTPFYIECKRGKNYLWDGHTLVRPHNEADMAWLYGNVQDKADEWNGDGGIVIVVWKLTGKKYCKGRKHIVWVTIAYPDWWKLKGGKLKSEIPQLKDRLYTITWTEFAEVLDNRNEVKG